MEKLEITPIDPATNRLVESERFAVQFNPGSYSIDKTVKWKPVYSRPARNAPRLEFSSSAGRTLKLDLFFDVTEPVDRNGWREPIDDVRELTSRVVALTRQVQTLKGRQPPVVRLDWGGAPPLLSDFPFIGVVESLSQSFTMFSAIGRPLRANLSLSFAETSDPTQDSLLQVQDSTLQKIVRGASLARMAASQYGDPAQWRKIASSNGIDNPLKLNVGGTLKLPKL